MPSTQQRFLHRDVYAVVEYVPASDEWRDEMLRRAPRVMHSFRAPRPTTNPYIVQLDRELRSRSDVAHLRFSWKTALLTRVDVLHFHWPETLLEGDRAWKRFGKRALFRALLVKLRVTRAAIVRTAHNIELPTGIDKATSRLLFRVEERTTHRILLNRHTELPWASPTTLIPHGHYRDWFEPFARTAKTPGQIGYFGLIRRYKGLETLLAAYRKVALDPATSLRIGGKPSSTELSSSTADEIARLPRARGLLRFLTDAELVDIASSSQLIVLPYRFMHNSGGALAALSLDRPVLVPRNAVNDDLSAEVGPGWIYQFEGELTSEELARALSATASTSGHPNLTQRNWTNAGAQHAKVYHEAIKEKRTRT